VRAAQNEGDRIFYNGSLSVTHLALDPNAGKKKPQETADLALRYLFA
jgi:hypothetical protein